MLADYARHARAAGHTEIYRRRRGPPARRRTGGRVIP